jgi:hypothetical protein
MYNVTLNDGWNLTEIGATVDSQVPETITAFGALATGLAALVPGGLQPGLYEIVYDKDKKISGIRKIDLTPN